MATVTEQAAKDGKKYDYAFGCDGVMSREEACAFLGGVSFNTLDRRCQEGLLRRGKQPGGRRVGICRRSMTNYLKSIEQ